MKALVIYSHPNPESFNGSILETVTGVLSKGKHEVRVKDLYRMNWNPLLSTSDMEKIYSGQVPEDIAAEQADVRWADLLCFIYPIWWFEQPAILKGWIDRVFNHGFAYRLIENGMIEGLLKGKRAVVITTSGADENNMRQNGVIDAIETCMIHGTLEFSGFENVIYKNLYSVPTVSDQERKSMLAEVEGIFKKNFAPAQAGV